MAVSYCVLYTAQKVQKHKKWREGILNCEYGNGYIKAVLWHADDSFVKIRSIETAQLPHGDINSLRGKEVEFPQHLVQIDDLFGNNDQPPPPPPPVPVAHNSPPCHLNQGQRKRKALHTLTKPAAQSIFATTAKLPPSLVQTDDSKLRKLSINNPPVQLPHSANRIESGIESFPQAPRPCTQNRLEIDTPAAKVPTPQRRSERDEVNGGELFRNVVYNFKLSYANRRSAQQDEWCSALPLSDTRLASWP